MDGTPTDCVNVAITQVLKRLPDLIVSGINKGWNLGDDVTYSGTVAGALEGALLGVPGIAVSLRQTQRRLRLFGTRRRLRRRSRPALLQHQLPPRTFLNVNVPKGEPKGMRVTVHGQAQSRDLGGRAARSEGAPVFLD